MQPCWEAAEKRALPIVVRALESITADPTGTDAKAAAAPAAADGRPAPDAASLGEASMETLAKHLLDFIAVVGPHCRWPSEPPKECAPACPGPDSAASVAWRFLARGSNPWMGTVSARAFYFALQGPAFVGCRCRALAALSSAVAHLPSALQGAAHLRKGLLSSELFSLHVYLLGSLCLLFRKCMGQGQVGQLGREYERASTACLHQTDLPASVSVSVQAPGCSFAGSWVVALEPAWPALQEAASLLCRYMAGTARGRDDFDFEFASTDPTAAAARLDEFRCGRVGRGTAIGAVRRQMH